MSDNGSSRYELGLKIRRDVLGSEYVDRSLNPASDFGEPLQKLITEYCWGSVWGRDGLDRRIRSLVNIALLTSMNRQDELKLHVQGALRNGCSEVEVRETLLQTAVYCGIPAALEAFRTAEAAISLARDNFQGLTSDNW